MRIEEFINAFITRSVERTLRILKRLTPSPVRAFCKKLMLLLHFGITNFKTLPGTLKVQLIVLIGKLKSMALTFDYRAKFIETSQLIKGHYKTQSSRGAGKLKTLLSMPIMMLGQWLRGLSTLQSIMLMGFTCASFLAAITIVSSGNRLITRNNFTSRGPASIEEEIRYERPAYYKKNLRHVLVSNVRLPVYIGEVNELRSLDIDFNATMSNRHTKHFLEKHEFQLRDHLILHIEPLVASFPLEDEGREILKNKIKLEIDNFLKERKVDGHVQELKVTYVLAN